MKSFTTVTQIDDTSDDETPHRHPDHQTRRQTKTVQLNLKRRAHGTHVFSCELLCLGDPLWKPNLDKRHHGSLREPF